MPHRNFDAGRRAADPERDPVTFALGGDTFTVVPDPSLGDTLDLADAPDLPERQLDLEQVVPLELVRALKRFIRAMLDPDDRDRFDLALFRVPARDGYVFVEIASYITEHVTGFPTEPPANSSGGRTSTTTGTGTSKRGSAGRTTSGKSRRNGRSR